MHTRTCAHMQLPILTMKRALLPSHAHTPHLADAFWSHYHTTTRSHEQTHTLLFSCRGFFLEQYRPCSPCRRLALGPIQADSDLCIPQVLSALCAGIHSITTSKTTSCKSCLRCCPLYSQIQNCIPQVLSALCTVVHSKARSKLRPASFLFALCAGVHSITRYKSTSGQERVP